MALELSDDDARLIEQIIVLAKKERVLKVNLIECLQRIDEKRLFSALKIRSLYHFCLEKLGMSEGESYAIVKSARFTKVYPDIKDKLIEGKINIGNISKVSNFFDSNPTIKRGRRDEIIKSIEGKTGSECQTTLTLNGDIDTQKRDKEILRTVSFGHKRLSVTLHEDTVSRLMRVKNLSAHRGIFSYKETIDFMSKLTLKKIDPSLRQTKKKVTKKIVQAASKTSSSRKISVYLKSAVWKRASGVCEQCQSDFCLEIDHVIPIAKGGLSEFHNLRLLCKNCNQAEALKSFGKKHMDNFL